jgi:hypothetical protein
METHQAITWVKDPAFKTPKAVGALKEISKTTPSHPNGRETHEATPPNPNGRGVVDQPKAREAVLTPKAVMAVGCWNVRTLLTTGAVSVLMHELKNGTSSVFRKRTGREWKTPGSAATESWAVGERISIDPEWHWY